MASVTIKNPAGKDAGSVDLDDALFGVQPNVPLMHQVVTAQLAARRSGSASTKTRSQVRGGGAKPYRQKGTGNARQGSIRSPQFTGGGVAHGPTPRSFAQKTPKKMIKAALRSALSDRAHDGRVVVVESWGIDTPRTKDAKRALEALDLDGTVLVVLGADDDAARLSFRNLPGVQVINVAELNAYDVLCNDWIVFTRATLPTAPAGSAGDESTVAKVRGAVTDTAAAVADVAEDAAETVRDAVGSVVESVKDVAEDVLDAVTGDDDETDSEGETTKNAAEGSASDEAGVEPDQTNTAGTDSEGETSETAAEGSASDEAGVEPDQTNTAGTDSEGETIK